MSMQQMILE